MANRKSRKRKASKKNEWVIHDVEKTGKGEFRIKATRIKSSKLGAGRRDILQEEKKREATSNHQHDVDVPPLSKRPGCLVTLKLDAFSVETGIRPWELYQITSSFEDLLKTAAEESGNHAIVDVRVSTIQEGCMSFQLPIIIIQNLNIDVGTSTSNVLTTVFNGLEVYLSYLAIRYAKGRRGNDEDTKLDDWLKDNAVPEVQRRVIRSEGFLESFLRLLTLASRSKKGGVTLIADLPSKQRKGKQGHFELSVTPDDVQRIEEHLEESKGQNEGLDSSDC